MCMLFILALCSFLFFFFNDTATTEIYTLSLHDALPISSRTARAPTSRRPRRCRRLPVTMRGPVRTRGPRRSEEHTSELQSRLHLVCRLLLEKKKKKQTSTHVLIKLCRHERVTISTIGVV